MHEDPNKDEKINLNREFQHQTHIQDVYKTLKEDVKEDVKIGHEVPYLFGRNVFEKQHLCTDLQSQLRRYCCEFLAHCSRDVWFAVLAKVNRSSTRCQQELVKKVRSSNGSKEGLYV